MRKTQLFGGWMLILFLFVSINAQESNSEAKDYVLKSDLHVEMADGIHLATDIYLPREEGQFPCVLIRSPYNKNHSKKDAEWFVQQDVAVVVQDTRGKFASEGKFYPFWHERCDGLACVEWIRRQPWFGGKIGGWGGSYVGYTQWAISDALDALTPLLTSAEMYGLIYPGGLFSLASAFNWGLVVNAQKNNPIPPQKILDAYGRLPLSVADDSTGFPNQFLDDWLRHEIEDHYWQRMNHRGPVTAPVLSVAGWYDIFLKSQITDFQKLDSGIHPASRLIIGPLVHGKPAVEMDWGGEEKTGDFQGLARQFLVAQLTDASKDWLLPPFKPNRYSLFIMQRNEYYGCDKWPPKSVSFQSYYLNDNQKLSPAPSSEKSKVEFTYDPMNPFISKGGTFLGVGVGPAWQNDNLNRKDQAAFESEVFEQPLTLLGPIDAVIYCRTDAPATDFIACLQDVYPDGQILNIQEGGTSVSGDTTCTSRFRRAELSLWATGYEIAKGHKLRLVLTSSLFPRFNRNLNNAESIFEARKSRVARQEIYFGKDHPSRVILPVLKAE